MWTNEVGYNEYQALNENHLKRQHHTAREVNAILMFQTARSELMKENILDNKNVCSAEKVANTLRTSKKLMESPQPNVTTGLSPQTTCFARDYHLDHLNAEMEYKATKNFQHREVKVNKGKPIETFLIYHQHPLLRRRLQQRNNHS